MRTRKEGQVLDNERKIEISPFNINQIKDRYYKRSENTINI